MKSKKYGAQNVMSRNLRSILLNAAFLFILFIYFTGIDIIPFICTLIACLSYSIEFGIIIGIAVNTSFVLYNVARPGIHVYNRKVNSCLHENCDRIFLTYLESIFVYVVSDS